MFSIEQNKYSDFLKSIKVLPFENWTSVEIEHSPPSSKEKQKQFEDELQRFSKKSGKMINGLYLYQQKDEILYVGKGKPIYNRIKSHYRESFQQVPGDTKFNTWHNFFSTYSGSLKLYIIEIEEETDRRILELILQKILNPVFGGYRKILEK